MQPNIKTTPTSNSWISTLKVQLEGKDPNDAASNSWMPKSTCKSFNHQAHAQKNSEDQISSNLPSSTRPFLSVFFLQVVSWYVQSDKSWDLGSFHFIIRSYGTKFHGEMDFVTLGIPFAVIFGCCCFFLWYRRYQGNQLQGNWDIPTRALREVQHHDIPLAMWASKIWREMVRLVMSEGR